MSLERYRKEQTDRQINKHTSKEWGKIGSDRKEHEWNEEVKIDRVTLVNICVKSSSVQKERKSKHGESHNGKIKEIKRKKTQGEIQGK